MIWLAAIAIYAMCFACATYLVLTEHYGWAWIPFLIAANLEFEQKPKQDDEDDLETPCPHLWATDGLNPTKCVHCGESPKPWVGR